MSLFDWIDNKTRNWRWYDFGLLKICVAAFVLAVADLWPALLMPGWTVYGTIFLIVYIALLFRVFVLKRN